MPSASEEKYLSEIYLLVIKKGYARVSHLAKILNVSVPSVSKMVKKLKKDNFIDYQSYGTITMTEKGFLKGKELACNRKILHQFFRYIGVEENRIEEEVKNIEYYISSDVTSKIEQLLTEKK